MSTSPILRVLLVRHGQSANNVLLEQSFENFSGGRVPDAPLTDAGIAQAALAGDFLASAQAFLPTPLTALYSSAMDRAVHTASIIGDRTGLRPVVWPELHEVGGAFSNILDPQSGALLGYRGVPGMGRSALAARYPDAILPPNGGGDSDNNEIVGGILDERGWWQSEQRETEEDAVRRIDRVLSALKRRAWLIGARHRENEQAVTLPIDVTSVAAHGFASALATALNASDECLAAETAMTLQGPDRPAHGLRLTALSGEHNIIAAAPPSSSSLKRIERAASRIAELNQRWCAPPNAFSEAIALVCHGDMIDTLLRLICGALRVDDATGHVHDAFARHTHEKAAAACAAAGSGATDAGANEASSAKNNASFSDDSDAPLDPTAAEIYGTGLDAPAALAVYAAAAGHTTTPLRFITHNCGIVWLDFHPSGDVRIGRVNDVRHLSGVPRWVGVPASLSDGVQQRRSGVADEEEDIDDVSYDAIIREFIATAVELYGHYNKTDDGRWRASGAPPQQHRRAIHYDHAARSCSVVPWARGGSGPLLASPLLTAGTTAVI